MKQDGPFLRAYLKLVSNHPRLVVVLAVALAIGGASLAGRVSLNPNLEALLPQDSPSRRATAQARLRTPNTSPLYLVVQSPDASVNRRIAEELRVRLEAWPDLRWVMSRRDPQYFLDRELLYLPAEDLNAFAEEVEASTQYFECASIPGCVNLDDEPPRPQLQSLQELYGDIPAVRSLASLFGEDTLPELRSGPPSSPTRSRGDLCSRDGTVCAVVAVLQGDAGDLTYASDVLERAEGLLDEVRPPGAERLKLVVSGRFRNAPLARRTVERDLKTTGALSLVLVSLLLALRFRGLRPIGLLLCPVVVGLAWTIGVVALVQPELNVISAFSLAILLGLGVDFGIHLLIHVEVLSAAGLSVHDTVSRAVRAVSHSMIAAALTTACAFSVLGLSSFAGFAQLGLVAGIGIVLTLIATFAVIPPLLIVLARDDRPLSRPAPAIACLKRQPPPRRAKVVVVVGILVALAAAALGHGGLELETNMRNIGPASTGHGIAWSRAMHGTNRTAVVLLASDAQALEDAAQDLRAVTLHPASGGSAAFTVVTPQTFIPPDQRARLAAISRLRAAVEVAKRHADAELLRDIERWSPLLAVSDPIVAEELPTWVRNAFSERDGEVGRLGVAYISLSGADARDMEMLSNAMASWRHEHPNVVFASAVALLGEVLPGLRRDAPIMVGFALLGLALATLVVGRSLRRTALALIPVVLAMSISVGVMAALGLRVNLYNMLVFPLACGIGVDGAIYLSWNARSPAGELDWPTIRTSGSAVLTSTLTTMAAYGSLLIASDRGVQSLGLVALICLGSTLVVNMVWLVAVLCTKGVDTHHA